MCWLLPKKKASLIRTLHRCLGPHHLKIFKGPQLRRVVHCLYVPFSAMRKRLFAVGLLIAQRTLGATRNITIDDTRGDLVTGQQILCSPVEAWSFGPTCQACTAKVTPTQNASDGTWHDATHQVGGPIISASAEFNGSAVYVMCILTRTTVSPDGNTDMTFLLDEEMVGNYSLVPNGSPGYTFNVPVFAREILSPRLHNITILSGLAGNKSLVLLDSIVYTTEVSDDQPIPSPPSVLVPTDTVEPTNPTSTFPSASTTSITALSQHGEHQVVVIIIGAVVASAVASIIVAVAVYWYGRRGRRMVPSPRLEGTSAMPPEIGERGLETSRTSATRTTCEDDRPPSYDSINTERCEPTPLRRKQ